MNVFAGIRAKFRKSFQNELTAIIYSVLIGCVAWFVISVTIYPIQPKTITEIPLTIDLAGTPAEEAGLSVVSTDWQTITVDASIQGNRSQIGSLKSSDLIATVSLDGINTIGKQTLPIQLVSKNGVAFTVDSLTPKTVDVTFDRIESKEVPVRASLPNVTFAEGKTMGDILSSPSVVNVTGASTALSQLSYVRLNISEKRELSNTYNFTDCTDVTYCDEIGGEIDPASFSLDTTSFYVTVPVYTCKELGFDLDIKYVPSNFDIGFLKQRLKFNYDSITIAALSKDSDISNLENWTLGSISLSAIVPDFNKDFAIEEKTGYINHSQIESVNASLDMTGLATKTFRVSDISPVNAPANYDCSVVAQHLSITLLGNAETIAKLTEKDILATVDLTGHMMTESSFSAAVTVTIPNYDDVWAVNDYNVLVNATKKPTEP